MRQLLIDAIPGFEFPRKRLDYVFPKGAMDAPEMIRDYFDGGDIVIDNNYTGDLDGEEIIYEIEEKEVEGYVTFYDGYDITNAYKATGEITPPNTGITNEDVTVNTVLSVNAIEIPTTTKPSDIIALIFIAITSIGLTNRYKRKIESR